DKDDGYSTNETGKAMEAKTQLLAGEDNGNKVDKYDANVKVLDQCINQQCCDLGRKLMEQMKEFADKDDGYSTKETGNAMEAKAQFLAGWARYGEPTFGEMSADGFCCIM
ncbi:hypothetical protein A2U01_0012244, partial [Trifolium medium]|nr:hypothetical protein [Trifolium medium]